MLLRLLRSEADRHWAHLWSRWMYSHHHYGLRKTISLLKNKSTHRTMGRTAGILTPQEGEIRDRTANSSLLQTVQNLKENGAENDVIDPYWTLVMYYNSLRELGGGQSALRENIPRWMRQYGEATQPNIRNLAEGGDGELTSRKVQQNWQFRGSVWTSTGSDPSVVDVLSTSNMFQVGVDIPRLGLMSIIGQPRSNSEYIQSRAVLVVNPTIKGLVLSILRGTYPRDQSHYEQFRSFHQEFYRHVDFTSVTPFTIAHLTEDLRHHWWCCYGWVVKDCHQKLGLSELRGNQVRDEAEGLVTRFTEMVRSRQTDIDNASEELVEEAVRIIESEWDRLQRFVDGTDVPVWWIVWNDLEIRSITRNHSLGWQVLPWSTKPRRTRRWWLTITERCCGWGPTEIRGRFISSPCQKASWWVTWGGIFGKKGIPYLTNGISLWDNTIETGFRQRTNGSEALNPASDGVLSGQLIEEPSLSTILGLGKPFDCAGAGKDGKQLGKHGAITYKQYPWIHVCDDHGHIGPTTLTVQKKFVCSHHGCGSSTRPSRFVSLCDAGHMKPFDYWFWVHSGRDNGCTEQRMRLKIGNDSALTLSNWVVHCDACGLKRYAAGAVVKADDRRDAPPCKGKREWLAKAQQEMKLAVNIVWYIVKWEIHRWQWMMVDQSCLFRPIQHGNLSIGTCLRGFELAHSKEHFTDQWMEDVKKRTLLDKPIRRTTQGNWFSKFGWYIDINV